MSREFETMYRKYELYNGGEKLFGLDESQYPIIVQTKEELRLLDSLYNLYKKVSTQFDVYKVSVVPQKRLEFVQHKVLGEF